MKILQVSPSYYPAYEIGGPIIAVHELNKALVKKGVEILVLTTNVKLENKVTANVPIDVDGIKVIYFDYDKKFEFLGGTGWQYSLKLYEYFKKIVSQYDFINIIGIWNYPSTFAIRYCVKNNIPHLVSPHGSLKPEHFKTKGWKKLIYYNFLLKKYIKQAHIHFFSNQEAEESTQYFDMKIPAKIITNGVVFENFDSDRGIDVIYTKYPHLRGKKIILYLGRLHSVKGIELLIETFSKINVSNCILVIAGSGEEEYINSLKGSVNRLKLSDKVVFTGLLLGEEKKSILKAANLFVLLSYSEAFSMSILEALASGIPVVISDKCYFDEVQRSNSGIIVRHDLALIVKSITILLNDSKKCKIMSENAKRLVQNNYTWDKISKKYLDVAEGIINDTI